ncbi:unnamed protein product [Closterium sp. NIES-65]|nr:unnamed protein product [Closterium sp. NIES-65]
MLCPVVLLRSPPRPSYFPTLSLSKARMTAVAMLLPGLLLALLAAAIASIAVVRIITPLGRDAVYRGSVADDLSRDTESQQVNNPLMLPSASLPHCHHRFASACSRSQLALSLPPHPVSRCIPNARAVFCHLYFGNAAVGDGRDPHASQSVGASAGLGCDGWADEAEECNQVPPGMPCALP